MYGWYFAIIPIVFVVMNTAGFLLMRADKKRAQREQRRIPEAVLFIVAFLMGGLGSTIAMFAYRHKTKHWYFVVFFPIFTLISVLVLILGELYIAVAIAIGESFVAVVRAIFGQ